jgi:hypothetical protein
MSQRQFSDSLLPAGNIENVSDTAKKKEKTTDQKWDQNKKVYT